MRSPIKPGRGAGRPKGSKNKPKFELPEQRERYAKAETPLEYMLAVMRDPLADLKRRDKAAKAAAPYCHDKMSDKKPVGKKEQAEEEVAMAAIGTKWDDLLR